MDVGQNSLHELPEALPDLKFWGAADLIAEGRVCSRPLEGWRHACRSGIRAITPTHFTQDAKLFEESVSSRCIAVVPLVSASVSEQRNRSMARMSRPGTEP